MFTILNCAVVNYYACVYCTHYSSVLNTVNCEVLEGYCCTTHNIEHCIRTVSCKVLSMSKSISVTVNSNGLVEINGCTTNYYVIDKSNCITVNSSINCFLKCSVHYVTNLSNCFADCNVTVVTVCCNCCTGYSNNTFNRCIIVKVNNFNCFSNVRSINFNCCCTQNLTSSEFACCINLYVSLRNIAQSNVCIVSDNNSTDSKIRSAELT